MALKPFTPVSAGKAIEDSDVVGISKQGFYFPAAFVKEFDLDNKSSVLFYLDDEDPYTIGVEFLDDVTVPGSFKLGIQTSGKRITPASVFNASKALQEIRELDNPLRQKFPIVFDKKLKIFVISLRPMFEFSVKWDSKNQIPSDVSGIYRYRDTTGSVIYIGKGLVKNRANEAERSKWGIEKIEYSILPDEETSLRWEKYYLEEYRTEFGSLPAMNRISGHNV
jgi:hypothetical protein